MDGQSLTSLVRQLTAGAISGGRRRLRRGLVVAQLAVTVLLQASAGLLLRTYYNLAMWIIDSTRSGAKAPAINPLDAIQAD